jgi:hypothetical protein
MSNEKPAFIDVYEWGTCTLSVVYNSRDARNALLDRMGGTGVKVGARIAKMSLDDAMFRSHKAVIDGWKRNLSARGGPGAMLALGLSAMEVK